MGHHRLIHPPTFRPEDWLRFIQIDPFPGQWSKLGLTEEDCQVLEVLIMASPTRYQVIPGAHGIRKLRFSRKGSGQGKSGSYRVFYLYLPEYHHVLLMAIIEKAGQSDLSQAAKNSLAKVVDRLKGLLDKGIIR